MESLNVISQLSDFQLETQRLQIRPVIKADLMAIHQIHSDEQVNRYLPYQTWLSWDDARAWYARVLMRRRQEHAEQFVILRKHDDALIGSCIVFIHEFDSENLELGYVLARQFWGNGYMFEALETFVPVVTEFISRPTMYAVIESENTSSRKLISKLGFEQSHQKQEDDIRLVYYQRNFSGA